MRAIIVGVLLCVCGAGTADAQSAGRTKYAAPEVLEKVQEAYAKIDDATAAFTQTVSFKYARVEQSFSGTVMMKRGNKYRIESQQQTLVTDGRTVWAYSPVNNQLLIDSYKATPTAFSPEKFLLGLPKNYHAAFVDDSAPGSDIAYVLKLIPKSDAQKFLKSLKVWIDDSNWSVRKVEYIDMNGTRTVYALKDMTFDSGIPDERFTFTAPANVEVVDLRSVEKNSPKQ